MTMFSLDSMIRFIVLLKYKVLIRLVEHAVIVLASSTNNKHLKICRINFYTPILTTFHKESSKFNT